MIGLVRGDQPPTHTNAKGDQHRKALRRGEGLLGAHLFFWITLAQGGWRWVVLIKQATR